jgi:hypothetical protein
MVFDMELKEKLGDRTPYYYLTGHGGTIVDIMGKYPSLRWFLLRAWGGANEKLDTASANCDYRKLYEPGW